MKILTFEQLNVLFYEWSIIWLGHVDYLFIPQIFTNYLLYGRHCSKCQECGPNKRDKLPATRCYVQARKCFRSMSLLSAT